MAIREISQVRQLGARLFNGWRWGLACALFLAATAAADPVFDTRTPISFFTNVASRLLSDQLNVNLAHLEIYPTNQYTPAVHRLLQVTANILDAHNTNFYPSVFRPLFAEDAATNIFIIGYQPVTSVSGTGDPQLATPYAVGNLPGLASTATPLADANGPVNVYGVPWVVGAKSGLPNFNQLSLINAAQITRLLEVTRTSMDTATAVYATNQMYLVGISNNLGLVFWNSYSNSYPRPLQVFVFDQLTTVLANQAHSWSLTTNFTTNVLVSSWPGSQWSGLPPSAVPQTAAFLPINWGSVFLSPMAYNFNTAQFDPSDTWQATSPPLPLLPQFGLALTNDLQAYILDGSNVIDYVQLAAPTLAGGLNPPLADPNYPDSSEIYYQWSTNAPASSPENNCGTLNQLYISGHPPTSDGGPTPVPDMPTGGNWLAAANPTGLTTPAAEAVFFDGFFTPSFTYGGKVYVNRQIEMQAPYTPSRTVYTSCLLQANDPLVHYMAGDLNSSTGAGAIWSNNYWAQNGNWYHSDNPTTQPLPIPPTSPLGGRYQPWGKAGQLRAVTFVDTNACNLAIRDPFVWGSDDWNFPVGQSWSLSWLGQVHRGTPWQTVFLKSTNLLAYVTAVGETLLPIGSNTWASWTGDLQTDNTGAYAEAATTAPVQDWQLVSLLANILNTNDLRTQFSINTTDPGAWAVQLDGMTAWTNLEPTVNGLGIELSLDAILISSNSAQATLIADAIQASQVGKAKPTFSGIGDILAVPELSVGSPFLNWNYGVLQKDSLNDQAVEAIPSQLLPHLRVDPVGTMNWTNQQLQLNFSGYDGHLYAVQSSPDLQAWAGISTNSPVNGVLNVILSPVTNTAAQFYRSVLVQ